jgi:hypothetical protein
LHDLGQSSIIPFSVTRWVGNHPPVAVARNERRADFEGGLFIGRHPIV